MLSVSVHPIWFYFNLTLVTYEILLSCPHFQSQSWLMAFKVKIIGLHQGCFITLIHQECERLESEPKQKECITPGFWERAVPPLGRTVYFSKRRLLDRPWYCRYVVPEAYVYFVQLTVAAPSSHTWKCELTPASWRGLRISKSKLSGKPRLWNPEVKNRQGANCLWNVNGLFIKRLLQHLYLPLPPTPTLFLKCVFSLKWVGGNSGAGWPWWVCNCALFLLKDPISGRAVS